ncbi:MAG: hypothetical protein ACKOAD_09190 [Gammaproteobacteria bacterium]
MQAMNHLNNLLNQFKLMDKIAILRSGLVMALLVGITASTPTFWLYSFMIALFNIIAERAALDSNISLSLFQDLPVNLITAAFFLSLVLSGFIFGGNLGYKQGRIFSGAGNIFGGFMLALILESLVILMVYGVTWCLENNLVQLSNTKIILIIGLEWTLMWLCLYLGFKKGYQGSIIRNIEEF